MEISNSEIVPGTTLHCWVSNDAKYMAHRFMLYLGKDKNNPDNVLVHSKVHGWDIISLSELPKDGYRTMGRYNLVEELKDEEGPTSFTYQFNDVSDPVLITVKLLRGTWRIKQNFATPSWVIKKEVKKEGKIARSARS